MYGSAGYRRSLKYQHHESELTQQKGSYIRLSEYCVEVWKTVREVIICGLLVEGLKLLTEATLYLGVTRELVNGERESLSSRLVSRDAVDLSELLW